MSIIETLESKLWLKDLADAALKSVMSFAAAWNRHPSTKAAIAIGLFVLIGFALPMGAMGLAEADNQEDAFYKEIQAALHFQIEPLPEDSPDEERAARKSTSRIGNAVLSSASGFSRPTRRAIDTNRCHIKSSYTSATLDAMRNLKPVLKRFALNTHHRNTPTKSVVSMRITLRVNSGFMKLFRSGTA